MTTPRHSLSRTVLAGLTALTLLAGSPLGFLGGAAHAASVPGADAAPVASVPDSATTVHFCIAYQNPPICTGPLRPVLPKYPVLKLAR